MGKQVAAGSLKRQREERAYENRTAPKKRCNLIQRGNAVMITGFTSDLSIKEVLCLNG